MSNGTKDAPIDDAAHKARKVSNPFIIAVVIVILLGAIVFLTAGTFCWWQGWVFWMIYVVFMLAVATQLKANPQLLSRRAQTGEDSIANKPPAFLNLFFLCFIIPGFDHRFGWSSVPLWLIIASEVLIVLGCLIVLSVFRENTYASALINVENEQRVITTGPYHIVRHPMYLGLVLMVVFTPLALGSWWGLIFALLVIPINVIRLTGEEELLRRNLEGYESYCQVTRFRLFPGIW